MKYFFRGLCILDYDPITKQVELPRDTDGTGTLNFEACKFIAEDYDLLTNFFTAANQHADGKLKTEDLPADIEVN